MERILGEAIGVFLVLVVVIRIGFLLFLLGKGESVA